MDHGHTVTALSMASALPLRDKRVLVDHILYGFAECSGAFAVNDPYKRQPGHIGCVEVLLKFVDAIFNAIPTQIQLKAR